MNRSEYLMALYDALNDIPVQERTDIVSEYQEYFRSETEKGRTEEEISLSLGDPVTLAYAIKQRRGYDAHKQDTFYEKPRRRHGIIKRIASVITVAVILLTIFGGTVMFSISKGSGFIVGIGKKYEVNDIRETNINSAKNIIVKTVSANTSIQSSDYGKIKSSLVGNVRSTSPDYIPKLEITETGDTIIIEEKRKNFAIIGFNWENVNLDISIPESFQGTVEFEGKSGDFKASNLDVNDFSLRLSSGNIRLDDITLKNNMRLTSSSGDLTINELRAQELIIQSTSGNKKLNDIVIKDNFNINSTSGDTTLNDIRCHELGIDSTSGRVSVEKLQLERISVESKSGDINISDLEGDIQVEVVSGKIKVSVKEAKDEIYLKSSSGEIELKLPANTGFTLDSRVASGNIKCDFDLDNEESRDKELRGSYRNGNTAVNLRTTSGNIDIEKR
jgi:lia operon protein LiaG